MPRYLRIAPGRRTIPGVESFDYAISDTADVCVGDVLWIPFQRSQIPGIVMEEIKSSRFADKIKTIEKPHVFLRTGASGAMLAQILADRTFSSLPTIVHSWLRTVPKKIKPCNNQTSQKQKPIPPKRHWVVDRINHATQGIKITLQESEGRTLIVTPWQSRAELLSREFDIPCLQAKTADGECWRLIQSFVEDPKARLVVTRVGAWLSVLADHIIIDEPENDDHKQDESSPRYDARNIAFEATRLTGGQLTTIGTTPRLGTDLENIPTIDVPLRLEVWQKRSGSDVELLSPQTVNDIREAIEDNAPVIIIHPISGERARASCSDCGFEMTCASCQFPVSRTPTGVYCKRCGKHDAMMAECSSCGGTDFSRSRPGTASLQRAILNVFPNDDIRVVDVPAFWETELREHTRVILTDISLLGGYTEDIRRRERLVIAWRRMSAMVQIVHGELIGQGAEQWISHARSWLESDGVRSAWTDELRERSAFGYPPASKIAKIIVAGTDVKANSILEDLGRTFPSKRFSGPFPVPYRPKNPRWIIHIHDILPTELTVLKRFSKQCIIDLDPIAFFS